MSVAPVVHQPLATAAQWFHALSDETRLAIIAQLIDGEKCVCELTDALRAGQSRLSFHLRTLKDARILRDRRDGRWVYYSLNGDMLKEIEGFLHELPSRVLETKKRSSCCD